MKQMIVNYTHRPGRHCASTALSNWMAHFQRPMSEAMAFGIGAGLGMSYMSRPGKRPSKLVMTRSAFFELQFCQNLGLTHEIRKAESLAEERARIEEAVAAGIPLVIATDLRYFPHYNTKTHFNGHVVSLVGYDEEGVWLADTQFPELEPVDWENYENSRTSTAPPAIGGGYLTYWMEPPEKGWQPDLPDAIRKGLATQARIMLEPQWEGSGIDGYDRVIEDLPTWAEAEDRDWSYRFTYQVIERRGTGGAAFRDMYVEFLEEASAHVPEIAQTGMIELMRHAAQAWHEAAEEAKRHSELEVAENPGALMELFEVIKGFEQNFYRMAAEVGGAG